MERTPRLRTVVPDRHASELPHAKCFIEGLEGRVAMEVDGVQTTEFKQQSTHELASDALPSVARKYLEKRDVRGEDPIRDGRDEPNDITIWRTGQDYVRTASKNREVGFLRRRIGPTLEETTEIVRLDAYE